ncbi:MAG: trypsin-like peptidase domain-containing protein [Gammaproteobacteria bacterium]|nr:trypsin-like peptidase domain-containing protein [Gammaproteobacteria bacterium]
MNDWENAIVRVWHGRPNNGGTYQGTAFFIAPEYLVTAKHVVEGLAFTEICLQSDTGAWRGGGLRGVRKPFFHPKIDIAVLPLKKTVPEARVIPLSFQKDLSSGQRVTLAGYSTAEEGLESLEVQISASYGSYDLEAAHTPIAKGMSGGPVLFDGKLAGVTRAKDDTRTFILPLRAFSEFINEFCLQPIAPPDMDELKQLLKEIRISDGDANAFFRLAAPGSALVGTADAFFESCLNFLAQKKHAPPDEAPLFGFLEYSHAKIKEQAPTALLNTLDNWKNRVAGYLGIELQAVRTHVEKAKKVSLRGSGPPIVLVKIAPNIEPKKASDSDRFMLKAWVYSAGQYESMDLPEQDCPREELNKRLPDILSKAVRLLGGAEAQKALIEVVMPFGLFDWNVNHLQINAGPIAKVPLGTQYAIAIRSWDRIYHSDYDLVRPCWLGKWQSRPCSPELMKAAQMRCVSDKNACAESIYFELAGENSLVFLALSSLSLHEHTQKKKIFGTALGAGLPFAFWPPDPDQDFTALRTDIENLLCAHAVNEWPAMLKQRRFNEKCDPARQSLWNNLMMLWDDPERLPPDTDYRLFSPEE